MNHSSAKALLLFLLTTCQLFIVPLGFIFIVLLALHFGG